MDFSPENNSNPISVSEMKEFVIQKTKYKITENQFEEIEIVFREKWNELAGQFACRSDFNTYVYDKMQYQGKFVMQDLIEDVVGKILDYMESKGQYTTFSDN
jgi:hypothetical protein